jgi:hypothetical protein
MQQVSMTSSTNIFNIHLIQEDMDLTDDDYEENTDPMDMDLEEEEDTPMEIDITLDPDDEDLYYSTSSHSSESTLSPQDIEFFKVLDEPIIYTSSSTSNKPINKVIPPFKRLPQHTWLKQAIKNSLQKRFTKSGMAKSGLEKWEKLFWYQRLSRQYIEDRVAG